MFFHTINLIYLGLWWFVVLGYFVGVVTDDYCPYYEGAIKINLGRLSKLFRFHKSSSDQIWIVSFVIQLIAPVLIIVSIVFTIISLFHDYDYAVRFILIYALVSFMYLLLSGVVMTIYRGR